LLGCSNSEEIKQYETLLGCSSSEEIKQYEILLSCSNSEENKAMRNIAELFFFDIVNKIKKMVIILNCN